MTLGFLEEILLIIELTEQPVDPGRFRVSRLTVLDLQRGQRLRIETLALVILFLMILNKSPDFKL